MACHEVTGSPTSEKSACFQGSTLYCRVILSKALIVAFGSWLGLVRGPLRYQAGRPVGLPLHLGPALVSLLPTLVLLTFGDRLTVKIIFWPYEHV